MQTINLYSDSLEGRFITKAVEALREGAIIIYPTDTQYALGCDATNQKAIERLCKIKGINPEKNLLSIVCSDISQAAEYAKIDNRAFRYIKEFTPGPFTFILPVSSKLPRIFKGRKTVGVRIPDCRIAVALAESLGNPLLSSSAKSSDAHDDSTADIAETSADRYDRDVAVFINTGEVGHGYSTIVDLTDSYDPQIVRQGLGEFTY